jgi:hypothetical protein
MRMRMRMLWRGLAWEEGRGGESDARGERGGHSRAWLGDLGGFAIMDDGAIDVF